MKKSYFLLLAGCLISMAACKKTNDTECDRIGAKIIKYECDRVIFQLLTDENIGDADWEDYQTGQHYSNVVSWYNTCAVTELTQGQLSTLYVNIGTENSDPGNANCYQCLALPINPPTTKVEFTDLSLLPCDSIMSD
ncbi:MAG: hypothetical protein H7Y86_14145 [Rhizobacter sp.]|nr:hypothetical protein [Ferruginibacter sp.]